MTVWNEVALIFNLVEQTSVVVCRLQMNGV